MSDVMMFSIYSIWTMKTKLKSVKCEMTQIKIKLFEYNSVARHPSSSTDVAAGLETGSLQPDLNL